ncbi:hypothetical protein PI124_g11772 [Phytophthora idaei]|nr:hypothetical protein PI124_g11772 [Phytophthora idaei]
MKDLGICLFVLASLPVELLVIATEEELLLPLVDALPPLSELLVDEVAALPDASVEEVEVPVDEFPVLELDVVEVEDEVVALPSVVDPLLVIVSPFDEPVVVAVAEEEAVLVADAALSEAVALELDVVVAAALLVPDPVVEDVDAGEAALSVALLVDPDVSWALEDAADPDVPDTMMSELVVPSVWGLGAAASVSDVVLIVEDVAVVVDPPETSEVAIPELVVSLELLVVAVLVEAGLDPPEAPDDTDPEVATPRA